MANVVEAHNLSKAYGGVRAIDDLEVEIPAGEVHALLGANGAGKSTLVKALAGVVTPDSGVIEIGGRSFGSLTVEQSLDAGIRVGHQELAIYPRLTVAEHIVLGERGSRRQRRRGVEAYSELFEEWGLRIPLPAPIGDLPPAVQATVSLARALVGDASLVILDEPTAALGPKEVAGLFRIVRRRVGEGATVVWVSHRLREVSELCTSATVMRNGRRVYAGPIVDLDEDDLAELITAVPADAPPTPKAADLPELEGTAAEVGAPARPRAATATANGAEASLLSIRNLRLARTVADVSFDVRPGEIVGLAGLVGSGRTEILETLVGLRSVADGSIEINGREYRPRSPWEAMRDGIVLVPEERASQALFRERDVGFNLASARLRREGRGRRGWRAATRNYDETSQRLMDALKIRAPSLRTPITALSGGNQQKVVLGRVMIDSLTLLLLDEPTRGVDVGARRDFQGIIADLTARGIGVIYVASELGELEHCDRIVVVVEGQTTTEVVPGDSFDEDELTRLCFVPRMAASR